MSERSRLLVLVASGVLALTTGLSAQDAGNAIEELPLEEREASEMESLQTDFDAAMELFNSVRQADAIPLLSDLIVTLGGEVEAPDEERRHLLTEALFRRAEALLNLGENDAADADLETAARADIGFQPDPDAGVAQVDRHVRGRA